MRIFISAGEPSGDLHGSNLIRQLRARSPDCEITGLGGDRMADAGCDLLFPLCRLSVTWHHNILKNLRTFFRVLDEADASFRDRRPDAVILIDYPGFHWHLAHRAHDRGIPVFYFVPPQLWGWGGWRVRKVRKWVDHVLCTLPFEQRWYAERGVDAHYMGHPFFDELQGQRIDETFLAEQTARPGTIVALLPGSRLQEVRDNLLPFIDAARHIHEHAPEARFLIASFNEEQGRIAAEMLRGIDLPMEVHVGRTAEIIRLATACLSASGSVGLELLNRALPSVVYYRVTAMKRFFFRLLMKVRWLSLINLLADRTIVPEIRPSRPDGFAAAQSIIRWLTDESARLEVQRELRELRDRVAIPGACGRAADYILNELREKTQRPAA